MNQAHELTAEINPYLGDEENRYQWAQKQEIIALQNIISQIELSRSALQMHYSATRIKLFGSAGTEDKPGPLSLLYPVSMHAETVAWQLSRDMISNEHDLDHSLSSSISKSINLLRQLHAESDALLNLYPDEKTITEIKKLLPDEAEQIVAYKKEDVQLRSLIAVQELRYQGLLKPIRERLYANEYPPEIAEKIAADLHSIETPLTDTTVKIPVLQPQNKDNLA